MGDKTQQKGKQPCLKNVWQALCAAARKLWNALPRPIQWIIVRPGKWTALVLIGAFISQLFTDCTYQGCKGSISLLPDAIAKSLESEGWIHSFLMPSRALPNVPPAFQFHEATQLFSSYQDEIEKQNRKLIFKPRSLILTRICRPYEVRTVSVEATFEEFMKEFKGCFKLEKADNITSVYPQTSTPEIEKVDEGIYYCRCISEVIHAQDRPALNKELLRTLPF